MIDTNEMRDRAATFGSDYLTDEEWVAVIDRLEAAETAWKISDQTVYDLTEKVIPNIQEKLEAAEKERDDLLEVLKNIEEYWNQDQNETAMADACWHAINTARAAIIRVQGEKK